MARAHAHYADKEAGFSLLEVLVALTLIALLTGAVVFAGTREPDAREAFERDMRPRIAHQSRRAVLSQQVTGIEIRENGFAFGDYGTGEWMAGPLMSWPDNARLTLSLEGKIVAFTPEQPAHIIIFEPTGQASAFDLILRFADGTLTISGDNAGDITTERRQ